VSFPPQHLIVLVLRPVLVVQLLPLLLLSRARTRWW
jgi:hypothetical protein